MTSLICTHMVTNRGHIGFLAMWDFLLLWPVGN